MKNYISYALFLTLLSVQSAIFAHQVLPDATLAALEPEEYTRGATRLIQLPVLSQFRESGPAGSTNNSCPYHGLRNGIHVAQAMIEAAQATTHLGMLYDKAAMGQRLAHTGAWRRRILKKNPATRKGSDTDNLNCEEVEQLLKFERKKGVLHSKGVDFAIFENAKEYKVSDPDFEGFCVLNELKDIKGKLDRNEDVTGVIIVYVDTVERIEVLADKSIKRITTGHWISLVVTNTSTDRQYILMDSADTRRRFKNDKTIRSLLEYLEGVTAGVYELPYVPVSNKSSNPLWGIYDTHLASYGKFRVHGDQAQPAQTAVQPPTTSYTRKALYGLVAGFIAFVAYKYYLQHLRTSSEQKKLYAAPAVTGNV